MADYTNIKKLIWAEYPVLKQFSIFYGNGLTTLPVESLDDLIDAAVLELNSDILIYEHISVNSIKTILPDNAVSVTSAKMSAVFPFQGNRMVKATFDKASHTVFVNYYPSTVTYQRRMVNNDVASLVGDRLVYFKAYCLVKMAAKELSVLKTANMQVDNGTIDLSVLEEFLREKTKLCETLKAEILIYNSHF